MKIIPAPSCTTNPAQLAATKKAAKDELYTAGEPKLAFVDRGYIQHSPTRMKQAKEDKISDCEEFRKTLVSPSVAGGVRAERVKLLRSLSRRPETLRRSSWPNAISWRLFVTPTAKIRRRSQACSTSTLPLILIASKTEKSSSIGTAMASLPRPLPKEDRTRCALPPPVASSGHRHTDKGPVAR
jgi:hypothetical protein